MARLFLHPGGDGAVRHSRSARESIRSHGRQPRRILGLPAVLIRQGAQAFAGRVQWGRAAEKGCLSGPVAELSRDVSAARGLPAGARWAGGMRRLVARTVALAAALSAALVAYGDGTVEYENAHYAAVVSINRGGLLERVVSRASGETLLEGMTLYTDYGVYDERGFVGAAAGGTEGLDSRREGEALVVTAQGRLVGRPAEGKPPVRYRAEFRFDQGPAIHVAVRVRPEMDRAEVRGFLALMWVVPAMQRWCIRTIDGLLRHVYRQGEEAQRSYGRELPLDPVRPLVAATTAGGAELRVENIRASGTPAFTGPAIHGRAFFLCFLDGVPRDIKAGQESSLEFDFVVGKAER